MKYKRLRNYGYDNYKINGLIAMKLAKVTAIEIKYYISLFILYFRNAKINSKKFAC